MPTVLMMYTSRVMHDPTVTWCIPFVTLHLAYSLEDEAGIFYACLTHWAEAETNFFTEAEPFGFKNQVDVLKFKWQVTS